MPRKAIAKDESAAVEDKGDKVLVNFYADAAMLAKIDEYRWTNRIEGRA
jgi:hypothetical protein